MNEMNDTYKFIGQLAKAVEGLKIKISYTACIQILVDNGYPAYGNERGMASGIAASYRYWKEEDGENRDLDTCDAIANTFVSKKGYPSWWDK